MGTNYYLITNECNHCSRNDRLHIGKDSEGWTFVFRGYNNVISFQDWKNTFSHPGYIVDGRDNQISVADFVALVESKVAGQNHTDLCPEGNWKDEEGHSFSDNEFS